jgi:transcription elongation factor GreA
VIVKEEGYSEEEFQIVGSKETDPNSGKISYESPIGRALLNKRVGDIVRVKTPEGGINFKIIEIK